MPNLRLLVIELAVMVAIGFALAALGPYGSFNMGSFATRLAYWLPAALGGYAIVRPTVLLTGAAAERLVLPPLAGLIAGVLLAALPMTPFILWLNGDARGGPPTFEDWLQLYWQVALIGGGVTLLFFLLERPDEAPEVAVPASASVAQPADADTVPNAADRQSSFLSRLPPHLRTGLVALEMEDHYVRAHTAEGSALVLLRMRDAVAELAGVDGMRVHRSWWVARDAVERIARDGRGVRLTLKGGVVAPVARSSIPALRAAGWL